MATIDLPMNATAFHYSFPLQKMTPQETLQTIFSYTADFL